MSTTKFITALAVMALSATMAVAQPATDVGTSVTRHHNAAGMQGKRGADHRGPRGPEGRRGGAAGPFAKIGVARRLENLTEEQKTKLDTFVQESKAEAESLQKELRQAMKEAREKTDREARREAMKDAREKLKASETKVDAFLKGLLTKEQQTQVESKISGLRERAVNRARQMRKDDNKTSAAKTGKRGEWRKHDRKADGQKSGKKADGKGKKRWNKKNMKSGTPAPASDASTTSGTATSPFVHE